MFTDIDRRLGILIVALGVAAAISCGGDSPTAPVRVASLVLVPSPVDSIEINFTRTVTVEFFDGSGHALTGRSANWSSSDTTIATVTDAGVISAKHVGQALLTASADSATAQLTVVVTPPAIVKIAPVATSYRLTEGDTLTLPYPTLTDRAGTVFTSGRTVTYASTNPPVAQVTHTGFVTAAAPGSTAILLTSDSATASITLTVIAAPVRSIHVVPYLADVAVGHSLHTQASAFSASGKHLSARQYSYTSANPSVATVTGSGVISGVAPGSTTVTIATTDDSVTIPVSVAQLAVGAFQIDLRFVGIVSPAVRQAAAAAAARWEQVVSGALVPYRVTAAANECATGLPAIDEVVPNMIMYIQEDSIDGPGKTAAEGGPCIIRDNAPQLTALGTITVDSADAGDIASAGLITDLLTHEMGHILGIGTLWDPQVLPGFTTGIGGSDPEFTGHAARVASAALAFTSDSSSGVPIENTGGPGTRDGHWRQTVFGNELMTGTLHLGGNPLSLVTIDALADFGYKVVPEAADDFTALNKSNPGSFPVPSASRLIPILDRVHGPRFTVSPSGQLQPIKARIIPAK